MIIDVPIRFVRKETPTPHYATEGSVGADLHAMIDDEEIVMKPFIVYMVPTGISLQLPENVEAQIRPRSGLSIREGVTLVNSPSTIDWDYRGELVLPLIKLTEGEFVLRRKYRVAQIVFSMVPRATFKIVDNLTITGRGDGGFGSTGISPVE